jgi:selenocysteine lyase/cysteine desulfurase
MNEALRELFPITKSYVYLNHAAVSPLPTPTLVAINRQLVDVSQHGSVNFRSWVETKERCRLMIANMMDARPNQIAFMRNTSDGMSSIANGFKWQASDNIVTFRNEFPSNVYPWLLVGDVYGVEVRFCEERDECVDVEQLLNMIDEHTRIVAISHVQYASGYRADLRRIGEAARKVDALFVVDVMQSLGVVPIDVEELLIDAAACASHKWLLSPEGIGVLYLSERARDRIEPTLVGWISVPNPEDYYNFEQGWREGALAWETGTGPSSLFYGMEESLKLLTETGIEEIASHLETLTDYLCERLKDSDYEIVSSRNEKEKSQIVCIRHLKGLTPNEIYSQLKNQNIITAPRNDRLRIAPHLYNTKEEIDRLIEALVS